MYSLCRAIVSFDAGNISQTNYTEVNVRLVQVGLVTEDLVVFENFVVIEFTKLAFWQTKITILKILKHLASQGEYWRDWNCDEKVSRKLERNFGAWWQNTWQW